MKLAFAVTCRLLMLMILLSASTAFDVALHAQENTQEGEAPAEDAESPQKKMIDQMIKRQMDRAKKTFEAKMAVRIHEMTEVCKLSEDQTRQLRLAAKGSIVKALEDQKHRMEEMQAGFEGGDLNVNFVAGQAIMADVALEAIAEPVPAAQAAPAEPVKPAEPAEPADPAEQPEPPKPAENEGADSEPKAEAAVAAEQVEMVAPAMAIGVDFAMGMPFMGQNEQSNPWQQPIWVETVKSTLTEEQFKTLEAFENERTARTQKTRIQSYVQSLDTELHLNAGQRTDLEAWLEKDFRSFFTDPNVEYMFSSSMFMDDSFFVQVDDGQPQPAADPEHFKVVSKILTAEQMELWKTHYAETFRTLENMKSGGPEEGGFGIQQILAPFR
ncbi:MAG: hypothetical protein U0996_03225 [Planctomycetaceae bacterium]